MNDKLMQSIRAVEPGRYGCTLSDIAAIRDAGGGGPLDTGWDCFRYGFLKGQQAARAEAKRAKKQLMERDTSGWYRYLSRRLERNIDNEEFLQKLGTRAHILEELIKAKEAYPDD